MKYTLDDFSVMSVQYIQHSFEYFLKSMQECGIKHIDFWGGEPHYSNDKTEEAQLRLKSIKELIDSYNMEVVVYTPETLAYPLSYSHPEESVRNRTINYIKRAIDDALILNCKQVFINSGCGLRDVPANESMALLIDSYQQIVEYAKEKDVTLILEALQPYESNLITNLETIKKVLDVINSTHMKICIDVVAMEAASENLSQYFETFGTEKIGLIHFSDSHHYVLGEGENNFPLVSYLKTLSNYNYQGKIDLEINDSIYWLDPHDSIKKSVVWLEQNLSKI